MERYTLVENARLVSLADKSIKTVDILIKRVQDTGKGIIVEISDRIEKKNLRGATVTTINAEGGFALPRFTDLCCLFREPGAMYKEDIAATLRSAAVGGFGSLTAFYEDNSAYTPSDAISYILHHTQKSSIEVLPIAPIFTNGGEELSDIDMLKEVGAVAFTDRFTQGKSSALVRLAMEKLFEKDMLYIAFSNDTSLSEGGFVADGAVARMMKYKGIPASAEEISVMRNIILARETGCRLHLSAISTKTAVDTVRWAKREGVRVTCDTSPNHLFFDESAILYYGKSAKLMPPLRSESDRRAILEGIADGTIDAVASHHTPNDKESCKKPIESSPFGAIGLATLLPAFVEAAMVGGYADIFTLIKLLSANPEKIISGRRELPEIAVGAEGSFNIVSTAKKVTLTESFIRGRAKNTPFLGLDIQGETMAIVDGVEQK